MGERGAAGWGLALGLAAAVVDPLTRATETKGLAVGLVVLVLTAMRLPSWRLQWSWPRAALALLLGVTGLSLAWSAHPDPRPLLPWAIASALALAVPHEAAPTMAAHAAAALVVAQSLLKLSGVPAAGAGNVDWLGLPFVMAVPALVEHARRGSRRWLWLGLAAGGAALTVGSRAAIVGLVLATAIVLAPRKRLVAASLGGALGLAAIARREALTSALGGRMHIWRASVFDLPPHGHGAGSFEWAYREGQGALLRTLSLPEAAARYVSVRSAHHDLVQVTVESGVVGACLLALLLIGLALHLEAEGRVAALAVAIAGLADVPLQLPAGALFLGLLVARLADPDGETTRRRMVVPGAIAITLVVLMAQAAPRWWLQRQLSTWQAQPEAAPDALQPLAAHDGEARFALAVAQLDRGEAIAALDNLRPAPLPDLGVMLLRGRAHLQLEQPELAAREFRGVLHRNPALVRAWLGLAEAERRAGELGRAEAALDALKPLRPHDPRVHRLREQIRRDHIEVETRLDDPRQQVR